MAQQRASVGDAAPVDMMQLCRRLFPIGRSLTGDGVRQTLAILQQTVESVATARDAELFFNVHQVASGAEVFDWTVPAEWRVNHARLIGPDGQVVLDYDNHNLHLLGYSQPCKAKLALADLKEHLFSLPDRPQWIPYRTSYYAPNWGFCLAHELLERLPEGVYEVDIDTELFEGVMNWGEAFIPGETEDEILVSTHICHPSLANDNLSGLAVATALISALRTKTLRLGVRFVFLPATIGAIAWLAMNERKLAQIRHTLVLSNLGDAGPFHYKLSPDGDAIIDQVLTHLRDCDPRFKSLTLLPFTPYGYDERQYNSPGIALDAGSLMRTPFGQYPQYHTSGDNLDFISAESLQESFDLCAMTLDALQVNRVFRNLNPKGEPQLGRRGLYQRIGGNNQNASDQLAMLWILNQSDGHRSLVQIAQKSGLAIDTIARVAETLEQAELLEAVD